jgi:hypothetical protein
MTMNQFQTQGTTCKASLIHVDRELLILIFQPLSPLKTPCKRTSVAIEVKQVVAKSW